MRKTEETPAEIVICGGGIVGLVLALAVKKHLGIIPEVYEKATAFHDDVGAAISMYSNGLRVIRDISPDLLHAIRENGAAYEYRRWENHQGKIIADSDEFILCDGEYELSSIGIRRWKLQKVLYDAMIAEGIPILFSKATVDVQQIENELTEVTFQDGTKRATRLLFACDGGKSAVRGIVADEACKLRYTGVTCMMGIAQCKEQTFHGISFPNSVTTNCHSVYFPTGPNEVCFQVHWSIDEKDSDTLCWGNLSQELGRSECEKIAKRLKNDGWDEKYIDPLLNVMHAVKVGFCLLEPRLKKWTYDRIVLVGDAAHPPVPYIGQGAQMGIEDAGTIVSLLKNFCFDNGQLTFKNFDKVCEIYEKLRIPRTSEILDLSKEIGQMEEKRTTKAGSDEADLVIQGEVLMNGTLPSMLPGATFNYKRDIDAVVDEQKRTELEQEFEEHLAHFF